MRNFNRSCLYESSGPGGKGTKMKNRCSSDECKCSPPIINVHHYQCPLMRTPCPLHGYPFIYNLKSKKTQPDQCLVISFHPSLKTDKLFEPVKTFLSQACEADTKINFQYYSPRLSDGEEFKHREVQTNSEDFKKLANSCFVEKTKTFFSDKTNKVKKLKQCFNSPCSSVVHKSRSCTAIKEKIDRIFREGTGDGYPDKPKLEKRIKAGCCMKPELSSHFLYKRDFDLSEGEKSSKEKIDSDFTTKINNNLLDRNVFEIRSRKGFNRRVSGNIKPHFVYPSFVSPDPIKEKVQGHIESDEVSDLEKVNEGSQHPEVHFDEPKEDEGGHNKASPDGSHSGNMSSDSSGSVYFTPFIFVPGGNDKEIEHKGIQTVKTEPKMSYQWVQTIEYFHENVSNKNQIKKSDILVAKTNFIKTKETQTSAVFMPEACICSGPQMIPDKKEKEKPVKTNVEVQTSHSRRSTLLFSGFEHLEGVETLPKDNGVNEERVEVVEPVSVGIQTHEDPVTVVYYEPEMKFLKREESSENEKKSVGGEDSRSVGVQTGEITYERERRPENEEEPRRKGVKLQETRSLSALTHREPPMGFLVTDKIPKSEDKKEKVEEPKTVGVQTIIYYEPEMKFLSRAKSLESVSEVAELKPVGVQPQSNPEPVTVIYFEPETKPLRRKDESGKRGVLFSEEPQVKEIETGKKDESVGTEPETLMEEPEWEREKFDSVLSENKETQANSDTDTSQTSYYGSNSSNVTYVVESYVSEESEQVVVKNWNKSRSDGDMLDKRKCDCLTKADQASPPSCQCAGTNPNGLAFVEVYRSKKESYASSSPQNSKKAQQLKPETIIRKNEENNASFADLSDVIRIIDENFKRMFDRTIGKCDCQQTRERKPTADKEVMTDISGDIDVILQMATRPMVNAEIQACLPNLEEMPLAESSNPDQEPPTSICKVCSKVISMTTLSVGTNTPDGSYIQTKIQEVDMGTYCDDIPRGDIQPASGLKPKSTEIPSTSKGKLGGLKSVRMSTRTFVTRLERPPDSNVNPTRSPTPRRNITYSEPFSTSTTSLQRDLRRAQQECGVKPKSSRPTPSPRPRPTPTPKPKPRQAPLPQSRPQVVTRLIPDAYCGNIVATITTRRTPSAQTQERCPFEPPSTSCNDVTYVCPLPSRTNPDSCVQRTQSNKEPDPKQNHMTYHVTLSPLWSKDIMKMFQRKLKNISKSESSDSLNGSNGKQKRNHDGGSDGGPTGKKIKSIDRDKTNIFDTNPLEREAIDCFEFGKSQTDIIFKFVMKGENELVIEDESPWLTKNSGFVWAPSFPTPQFYSIREVSSAEETAKSKATQKEVNRTHSNILSKILEGNDCNNSSTKNARHQNFDQTGDKNLIKKLFRCSSCKSLAYIQLKNSDVVEKSKNNSTDSKSNAEDISRSLVFTPRSHSLVETPSWDPIPENSSLADEPISIIDSDQKHDETVPSVESKNPSSGTDQNQKFFEELYSKFLSEKSDSNFEIDSNQAETCENSKLPSSNSNKAFNTSRSNKFSFRESSADVSNSKMATKSECLRTFRFRPESGTTISDSKKTILKNFPSKMFQGSKRKSK